METMVNFEPKWNCPYHLSSFVPKWYSICQQGVVIIRKYVQRCVDS